MALEESQRLLREHVSPGDRVLAINGCGVRNVGDEAILEGLRHQLPEGVDLTVVSRDPQDTAVLHHLEAVSPWGSLLPLVRTDAVVMMGGMISGHMGPLGRLIPRYLQIVGLLGRKRLFHGIGIYSSTPADVKRQLRDILPRMDLITVRDPICVPVVEKLGGRATNVPDLSFSMPVHSTEEARRILEEEEISRDGPLVGLALTRTGMEDAADLISAFTSVIARFPEANFLFIPMSHHPWVETHNDLTLARELQSLVPRLDILKGWYHPGTVAALFGLLDAAVCMRYHSVLFAYRSDIPFRAIPYSEKVTDFLRRHDMTAQALDADALVRWLQKVL
ncbi:MAG: polysaccharide pyruvyl transferase family protein [Anaerolineae bacterium]